jgi:hypothetical protein
MIIKGRLGVKVFGISLIAALWLSAGPADAAGTTWRCRFPDLPNDPPVVVAKVATLAGGTMDWNHDVREAVLRETDRGLTFVRFTTTGGALVLTLVRETGDAILSSNLVMDAGMTGPALRPAQRSGHCE